jgi:hypothetical protein
LWTRSVLALEMMRAVFLPPSYAIRHPVWRMSIQSLELPIVVELSAFLDPEQRGHVATCSILWYQFAWVSNIWMLAHIETNHVPPNSAWYKLQNSCISHWSMCLAWTPYSKCIHQSG